MPFLVPFVFAFPLASFMRSLLLSLAYCKFWENEDGLPSKVFQNSYPLSPWGNRLTLGISPHT